MMQSNTTKINHFNIISIIEQHLDRGCVKNLFSKNHFNCFNHRTQKWFSAHKDWARNNTPIISMLEEYLKINTIPWTHVKFK